MSIDNVTTPETATEILPPEPQADSPQPPLIYYWRNLADAPFTETVFINAAHNPLIAHVDLTHVTVVLPSGGEEQARAWLDMGAERVLFADAAVQDTTLIRRMVEALGADKVGVWLPVKRMGVSWVLDKTSNADFSVMTPSIGKPSWEVLLSSGKRTGIDVDWWSRQMLAQGATCILISVDYTDWHDQNIAAELVEKFSNHLWLSPLYQDGVKWGAEAWQTYAKVQQMVIPPLPREEDHEEHV
ncbi:MAG: HisA/HisF-related TIM barrel protein [Thiothrix sp.]